MLIFLWSTLLVFSTEHFPSCKEVRDTTCLDEFSFLLSKNLFIIFSCNILIAVLRALFKALILGICKFSSKLIFNFSNVYGVFPSLFNCSVILVSVIGELIEISGTISEINSTETLL